jgi:hypothetical protein
MVARSPFGGHALLMLVGRIRQFPRRWHPSTVCTHNFASVPQPVHTTVLLPPVDPPLGCPPYGADTDL